MASNSAQGNGFTITGDSNNIATGEQSAAGNNNSVGRLPQSGARIHTPVLHEVPFPPTPTVSDRDVFVIHGQDEDARQAVFILLRSLNLRPLEWETLVERTGKATPFLGDVITLAASTTRAALVVLTPDDVVRLHPRLLNEERDPQEAQLTCQARPNVFIELGLALMAYPARTVIVEIGHMRRPSDIGGLNVIRFDRTTTSLRKIANRLRVAGCAVDDSGTDWLDPTRFAGLDTFDRRAE
ncbi:MAG TPA: nucleotide-binding protein [Actinocrinis sp.]|nr:nucleotide-binding protein [Actinocrinis sp.]